MYFKLLPSIVYPTPDGKQLVTKDIFKRVGLRKPTVSDLSLDNYYVLDGDTPDIVASKLYGNPKYHWILFLVNDMINPYDEWPRTDNELKDYVNRKYGSGNSGALHHYSVANSEPELVVDFDEAGVANGTIIEVTNYDYEYSLNQEKRQIKILRPKFVGDFVAQYKRLAAS